LQKQIIYADKVLQKQYEYVQSGCPQGIPSLRAQSPQTLGVFLKHTGHICFAFSVFSPGDSINRNAHATMLLLFSILFLPPFSLLFNNNFSCICTVVCYGAHRIYAGIQGWRVVPHSTLFGMSW
jgi:hypothetical protein